MDLRVYVVLLLCFSMVFNFSEVNGNTEGHSLNAFKKQLNDPDDFLKTWRVDILRDPCYWEHITCNQRRSVTRIDLGNANLSGQLVQQLAQLHNLEYLILFGNKLTGEIPIEFGNLSNLVGLNLCVNRLNGTIPESFGKLQKLRSLRLNNNLLTGTIPTSLASITTLGYLDVSHNDLHGDVPSSFSRIRHFKFNGNPKLRAPTVTPKASNPPNKKAIVGGAIAGAILLLVVTVAALALWRHRNPKDYFFDVPGEGDVDVQIGQLKRYSISELEAATSDFSHQNILGRGGSSDVYKGQLPDGSFVAIKRLTRDQTHGQLQFQMEVRVISTAVHRNLLPLGGYCIAPGDWFLIYPYMPNGSLATWLKAGRPDTRNPLDWTIRKRVALGSARGLAYLHHDCDPKIIHRDVKSGNILLDEDFEAVIGDFGLAIFMERKDTHVTTGVRGTVGFIAPEYQSTGRCSEKTDVFGYGMMLLELITGDSAIHIGGRTHHDDDAHDDDDDDDDDDVMLRDWIGKLYSKGKLDTLVDADLNGNYAQDEAEQLIKVALLCIQGNPLERPTMFDVVRIIEVGDGLDQRWEEWEKEEMIRKKELLRIENIMKNISNPDWRSSDSGDSIRELPPDE